MKYFKWAIVLSMVFTFTYGAVHPVQADVQNSDKATVLNKLGVLRGDGASFDLGSSMTRAQSLAFITRIMGVESAVIAIPAKYPAANFPDVKPDDWFAPYVNFAVNQKIVNGMPDGKFHPNDPISEKAFLKLMLVALGHPYQVEFGWNAVYSYAGKTGLINQSEASKTVDNLQYKRANVVDALYSSLLLTNKSTNVKVIDLLDKYHTLVPELAPTPAPTPTPTPQVDALPTAISSIAAQNSTTVTVTFNENVQALTALDIKISESGNATNSLSANIQSQSGDQLVLTTASQVSNKAYEIQINNVVDTLGNKVNAINGSFTGYVQQAVQSNLFKISKVETVSNNVLQVYFTQPINLNAALPYYYTILKNGSTLVKGDFTTMVVKPLGNVNNAVAIQLKTATIAAPATYAVNISGTLQSNYSVTLNNGTGDQAGFSANSLGNTPLRVISVMPVDSNTLQVYFNQELDANSAQTIGNYSVANTSNVPNYVSKAVLTGDGPQKNMSVLLKLSIGLNTSQNYNLTVKNVMDLLQQSTLPEFKYPFTGQGTAARKDLQLVNVSALDQTTLVAYFNRKLDSVSAVNTANYILSGVTSSGYTGSIASVYYDPQNNPYMVKLAINGQNLVAGDTYKLQVLAGMQDILGDTSLASVTANFSGSGTAYIKPLIYQAIIIGKDTIRFQTNVEVANSGNNISTSNYSLQYKDSSNNTVTVPCSSVGFVDGTTGILKFNNLDMTKVYTLSFTSLTDFSNLHTRTSADQLTSVAVAYGS